MKHCKYGIFLIIVLSVLFFACACSGNKQGFDNTKKTPTESLTDDSDDTSVTPVITGENFNLIAMKYYIVNASNSTLKTTTAMIRDDAEITPKLILDYICDSLEDESVTLSYKSIEVNDGICTINFDDSIIRIAEQNADLEEAILDAASQSILDNIEGCRGISLMINDGEYSTQNLKFSLTDIYMDD